MRKILSSKIHRAFVTKADINYVGSISIDTKLLKAADISVYEEVQVVDITNGARLYTYAMPAPAGSGQIQINGAAAHLVKPNDIVIIMSFKYMKEEKMKNFKPKIVFVDQNNKIIEREKQVCLVNPE